MSKDSHSFSVSVAQQVGVPGAIIMQHFLFLQKANISGAENWQEKWVKRSAKSIAKTYPYWSGKQVASITDSLEKGEYLFSKIENASKIDRTKSFILTPKGLLLMGEIPFAQMENGFSKLGNANAQMENAIPENGKCNIEEDYTSFIPSFIEENAGASDPLSPPFKKVADIHPETFSLEAQQPETTSPGGGAPGAIRVSITGPEHPDITVQDIIEPKTDPPKNSRGKAKNPRTGTQEEIELATRVIEHLNQTAGRSFRVNTGENARGIIARHREGFTEAELLEVVEFKAGKWKADPEMYEYLNPVTLFRPANFERYLQAARVKIPTQPKTTHPKRSTINDFRGADYSKEQKF